jgi:hypothetical protein
MSNKDQDKTKIESSVLGCLSGWSATTISSSPATAAPATPGPFKSRVVGVGPQVGFIFPVGDMQGFLNLKAYKEFAGEHRPEGWNAWVTLAISPAAPTTPTPAKRLSLK